MGRWQVRNRRRRQWLAECQDWDEFDATCEARPILDGLGNIDEFRTGHSGGFTGMSLRLFHPGAGQWSIYWASTRHAGVLEPPVTGTFAGDTGTFDGADTVRRTAGACPVPLVGRHHARPAVGASLLRRQWPDLGNQLGDGLHPRLTGFLVPAQSPPGPLTRARRSLRCPPSASPSPP